MSCVANLPATTKYFKHLNVDYWPTNLAFYKTKNTFIYFTKTTCTQGENILTALFLFSKLTKLIVYANFNLNLMSF